MKVRKIRCIKDGLFVNEGDIMIEYGLDKKGMFYFEGEEKLSGKGLPIDNIMTLKDKKISEYFEEVEMVDFANTPWGQNVSYLMNENLKKMKTQKNNLASQIDDLAEKILEENTKYQVIFGIAPEAENDFGFNEADKEIEYSNIC